MRSKNAETQQRCNSGLCGPVYLAVCLAGRSLSRLPPCLPSCTHLTVDSLTEKGFHFCPYAVCRLSLRVLLLLLLLLVHNWCTSILYREAELNEEICTSPSAQVVLVGKKGGLCSSSKRAPLLEEGSLLVHLFPTIIIISNDSS